MASKDQYQKKYQRLRIGERKTGGRRGVNNVAEIKPAGWFASFQVCGAHRQNACSRQIIKARTAGNIMDARKNRLFTRNWNVLSL